MQSSGKPYNGQRTAGDLTKHAESLAGSAGGARLAPVQLTSAAVWSEACGGKTVCVVAVLPHVSIFIQRQGEEGGSPALQTRGS